MNKTFAAILSLLLIVLFVKYDFYENATWNIPTRFCRPSRFYSPYDYRGTINVPISESLPVFSQSEAIGENYAYCHDDYRNMMD